MKEDIMNDFSSQMTQRIGEKFDLTWDIDKKGVVCGWCKLAAPEDIYSVSELIADLKGRVMTISALNTKSANVILNYHFFFEGINCTVSITLPERNVKSITPVLKSADWHEREMQDLFNIKLQGHPNPKKLLLDENVHMTDHTMIPLSEAMNGASTSTLWEKIMQSKQKGSE